jgi:hypothetical protein
MFCIGDGFEDILPTMGGLIDLIIGKVYGRQEVVSHMWILVQGDTTPFSLGEVAVRNTLVLWVSNSQTPIRVTRGLQKLQFETYFGILELPFMIIVKRIPIINCLPCQEKEARS